MHSRYKKHSHYYLPLKSYIGLITLNCLQKHKVFVVSGMFCSLNKHNEIKILVHNHLWNTFCSRGIRTQDSDLSRIPLRIPLEAPVLV